MINKFRSGVSVLQTSSVDGLMGDSILDHSKSAFLNQIPKFGILIPNRIFVGSIAGSVSLSHFKISFKTASVGSLVMMLRAGSRILTGREDLKYLWDIGNNEQNGIFFSVC